MKPSACRVFAALMRGERLSIHDSKRLRCGAIGQRVSEIKTSPQLKNLGLTISSDWGRANGERQAWKVWWIEGAKPAPAPKPEFTFVTAHSRRLNIIEQEPEECQGSLFS